MTKKSQFIAIEGGDGSGKGTQTELLCKYCTEKLKKNVLKLSFPQYGKDSAYFVSEYLNGAYGTADEVPADLASLPYALDRFEAKNDIQAHLNDANGIVISDRYVASNMAHQGTKFATAAERKKFYERIMTTEYGVLGIPRPDKNIVLLVPAGVAQLNVDKKDARSYTDKKRDIHESNFSHLERAKANYEELCRVYPNEFIPIKCTNENGDMRPIDDIQLDIRAAIGI